MICALITHASMTFFLMFPTVLNTYGKRALLTFLLKRRSPKTFFILKFAINTIN